MFSPETKARKEEAIKAIFKKPYNSVTRSEITQAVEELICSLFMFRKNMPFNLPDIITVILEHPKTRYLDKMSLMVALEKFDIDINKLNSQYLLGEQPLIMKEGPNSKFYQGSCFEAFYREDTFDTSPCEDSEI